ncbi:hypothetical protein [Aliiroseovarius crassostreae]|uniref:hypothetical protein n=1 Tax=Aliiroseovarius crassostreae TaxID=154981 RepID=UPI0022020626|nr:hypothetical protein [Aliiroseovarius crassostreae]UWQ05533.1 hypothetical protein K3X22_03505 [Aliiroseovarius crassostreae]
MSDISELETRITTALERIGAGIDTLTPAKPDQSDEVARLSAALEDERIVNAQLEERVKAIKEKQDSTVQVLSAEVERLTALLASEEKALAKLRQVNADLRHNNDALREAANQGVVEPHLINKSMMAELEGLRAAQTADRTELNAVLGELNSLISKAETQQVEAAQTQENMDA